MASKLEIVNIALLRIGERKLSSLTENSANRNAIDTVYDFSRNSMLRSFPWSFSIDTIEPTLITTETTYDYLYVYELPANCHFIITLLAQNQSIVADWSWDERTYIGDVNEWEVRENKLYCNISGAVVKYSKLVTDETEWDDLFADAMAWRIAVEIAMPITKKPELQSAAANGLMTTLKIARGLDKAESRRKLRMGREWLLARSSGRTRISSVN